MAHCLGAEVEEGGWEMVELLARSQAAPSYAKGGGRALAGARRGWAGKDQSWGASFCCTVA